jgi:hypothetical protein
VLICVAAVLVVRSHRLTRQLDGARGAVLRSPLEDVSRLVRLPMPSVGSWRLLLMTTGVAGLAAFVRDRGEHSQVGQSLTTAGIEIVAIIACFVVLGPPLGLLRRR